MASSKKGSAGRPKTPTRPTSARPVTGATRTAAGAPGKGPASTPLSAKTTTAGGDNPTTTTTGGAKSTAPLAGAAKTAASGTKATPSVRRSASATATQRQRQRQAQLARQRQRQYITAGVIAVVVVALAILVFALIPHAGTTTKKATSATATTSGNAASGYGILANFTPGAKGNIPGVNAIPTNLDDGLQYVDVKVGSGQAVQSTDTITVNYTGWLTDGTKFDSSYDHGQAAQFPLSGVIPGWTKGLVGMKIGGERRLLIPPALAYGAQGQPPTIPANATLIFDVTLVSIP